MSFIQFESGSAKEVARQALRETRSELLKKAEQNFKHQEEKELQKKFRGEDRWMLPSVSKKIEQNSDRHDEKSKKKSKKEKKSKKPKKEKKKRRKRKSSGSDSDDSSEEEILKKRKKRHYSTDSDEWVERAEASSPKDNKAVAIACNESEGDVVKTVRDDWMSGILIPTFSKQDTEKKKEVRKDIDSYDPTKSSRELNPFWKNGGTGLPEFRKPNYDSGDDANTNYHKRHKSSEHKSTTKSNWRKRDAHPKATYTSKSPDPSMKNKSGSSQVNVRRSRSPEVHRRRKSSSSSSSPEIKPKVVSAETKSSSSSGITDFLTDQQMNELGAKIIKAEIMGNSDLIQELQQKLEKARNYRTTHKNDIRNKITNNTTNTKPEDILLTTTNSQGLSKPLQRSTVSYSASSDQWGGRSGKKKSKKVETHAAGERLRYFADDDKYDIKQMFEREKFITSSDQDEQFANIAGKHKNPKDDLEDIFAEQVRKGLSETDMDDKEKSRAIRQHQELTKTLESCDKCFESAKMEKQLICALGTNVYLSLPWHEGLQVGHCMIIPMQHVSCSTQLDEDVWAEVLDFQKALTNMFRSRSQDVIFFESARYLHKRPHMVIHCVANRDFELAPFYFKKAIQESEREWSTNKQLVTLKDKDVRRSIPKGLPYFWVHFGIDSGFAHVIEEQDRFPSNFAQEIIGGLLNLDARLWRRPRKEQNPIAKVKQFADWWKPFDICKD